MSERESDNEIESVYFEPELKEAPDISGRPLDHGFRERPAGPEPRVCLEGCRFLGWRVAGLVWRIWVEG